MAIKEMTKEEYEAKYGVKPPTSNTLVPSKTINNNTQPGLQQTGDFSTGLGKSVLRSVKGAGQIGTKIGNVLLPKSLEIPEVYSNESTKGGLLDQENLKAGEGEKFGSFVGDVAQFAIPGGAVSKLSKGANFATKLATRAATSGGVATIQQGEVGKDTAIAAGTEIAIPVAGKILKPAVKLLGNLLKGTGSGLSGAPSEALESIYKDGKVALKTAKEIRNSGGASVVKKNAETIINGVSKIKQEARNAYGKGLEQLAKTDIEPVTFKTNVQKVLDSVGSVIDKGSRKLNNVEFTDPKNVKKANELVNKLSNTDLDGKSLRKLIDDIESTAYKTATSDERLSYNVFVKKLAGGLKNAISSSTSKLDDINKAFSTDMQLAEATEKILGKVKYKNLGEISRVAKNLETMFTKTELDENIIDNFLERIGVSSGAFKASEAMRQVASKSFSPNSVGTNPFEILRAFTSAVVSPKMVGKIAAYTGLAEDVVKEMSQKLSPTTRAAVIKLLTGNPTQEPNGQ